MAPGASRRRRRRRELLTSKVGEEAQGGECWGRIREAGLAIEYVDLIVTASGEVSR